MVYLINNLDFDLVLTQQKLIFQRFTGLFKVFLFKVKNHKGAGGICDCMKQKSTRNICVELVNIHMGESTKISKKKKNTIIKLKYGKYDC